MKQTWPFLLVLLLSAPIAAQAQGSLVYATILEVQIGDDSYDYTITLVNDSQNAYDFFYFSYYPASSGISFLPSGPTSVSTPSGWSGQIIRYGGYGIVFQPLNNSSPPLLPNSSVVFSFDSPDSPSIIAGNSLVDGYAPEARVTSFLYEGGFTVAGAKKLCRNPWQSRRR
jgi:hypothetical protein